MNKDFKNLMNEYEAQEVETRSENEQLYTAYKQLSETTQGECCCASLCGLCCCGL